MESLPPRARIPIPGSRRPVGEKLKKSVRTSSTWVAPQRPGPLPRRSRLERPLPPGYHGHRVRPRRRRTRRDVLHVGIRRLRPAIDFQGAGSSPADPHRKALAPRRKLIQLFSTSMTLLPGRTVRGHVDVEWPKASPRPRHPGRPGRDGGDRNPDLAGIREEPVHLDLFRARHADRSRNGSCCGGRPDRLAPGRQGGADVPLRPAGIPGPRGRDATGSPLRIIVLPDTVLPTYEGTHATVKYRLYAVVDVPLAIRIAASRAS